MKQRSVAAGEFKNSCLRLMEEVHQNGIALTVTKRGKPMVRIIPANDDSTEDELLGTVVREAPNIFSTGEEWDAEK